MGLRRRGGGRLPALATATLLLLLLLLLLALGIVMRSQSRGVARSLPAPRPYARSVKQAPREGHGPLKRAAALARCTSFACLRAAHELPAPAGAFGFPHFFLLGFPKCATTSLAAWLGQHPQAVAPTPKETQFFTKAGGCVRSGEGEAWRCMVGPTKAYIADQLRRDAVVAAGLGRAAFDASTAYSWGGGYGAGAVAAGIRRELPWLRLVLSMREPISREISGRVHLMELNLRPQGPPSGMPRSECLLRLARRKASMYECVLPHLAETDATRYAESLRAWLAAWPRDQLHVVQARRGGATALWRGGLQYENLTAPASHAAVLNDLQRFLGLDPALAPPELPLANSRKAAKPKGWPMRRSEYQHLLSIAKERAHRLAALLEAEGFMPARQWLEAWEAAWQRNLDTCDAQGRCLIQVT